MGALLPEDYCQGCRERHSECSCTSRRIAELEAKLSKIKEWSELVGHLGNHEEWIVDPTEYGELDTILSGTPKVLAVVGGKLWFGDEVVSIEADLPGYDEWPDDPEKRYTVIVLAKEVE